jgi:hypothetical protein
MLGRDGFHILENVGGIAIKQTHRSDRTNGCWKCPYCESGSPAGRTRPWRARTRYDLAASGGEAPHPNTQDASDDKRNNAYPHRYLVSSDRYLRLFDQAHQVAKGKKRENHTRDAQSRSLWTHRRILAAGFRFVSKNGCSVLVAANSVGSAPNENKISYSY